MSLAILMPTYNGEKFLIEQIRSIKEQSFSDFELFVSDDGSADSTLQILHHAATKDKRIKIISQNGNVGQKNRLRLMLNQVWQDYVAFSDQDDIWDSNKLSLLMSHIEESPLAFGRSQLIDQNGKSLNLNIFDVLQREPDPSQRIRLIFEPMVSAHAMVVKKSYIGDAVFCRSLAFDWLLSLDVTFAARIAYIDEAVVFHRLHQNNQWNKSFSHVKPYQMSRLPKPRFIRRNGLQDRYQFCCVLDYLANSSIVFPPARVAFSKVLHLCEGSWFQDRKKGIARADETLREQVLNLLLPLATSVDDQSFGSNAIRLLTSHWR